MNALRNFLHLDAKDRRYVLFLGSIWLVGFFATIWRRMGIVELYVPITNTLFLSFMALKCYKSWERQIHPSDVALYLLFVLIYLFNAIIYPNTANLIIDNMLTVVLATFPYLFLGLIFKPEGYKEWIMLFSRLAVIANIAYSMFFTSGDEDLPEQMNRAYVLLPSVLYITWSVLDRYNIIDLGFCLVGFLIIMSMGSRGPLVCFLFFCSAYLFFFKSYNHPTIVRIFIIAGALILYSLSTVFAYLMLGILNAMGKSTRIFDSMVDGALLDYENSNGRNEIHELLLDKLNKNGGGFGLLADRPEVGYAHNIIVELWYDYGYIIGSLVIVIFLLFVLSLFLKSHNRNTKLFVLLFFTFTFIKLLFSGTFITDGFFFFLIGLCISGLRESKCDGICNTCQ